MSDLHLGQHISQRFNEELEDVRSKVLHMGGVVEEQLANALKVLVNDEHSLAAGVMESDAIVNSLEVEIDEECTRIVARRQPAATDLRLVMTVSKTINELERIGDEAKRIAKMSHNEMDGALQDDVRTELTLMGDQVRDMLRQVLDAFARTDVDTAVAVVKADSKVEVRTLCGLLWNRELFNLFKMQFRRDNASQPIREIIHRCFQSLARRNGALYNRCAAWRFRRLRSMAFQKANGRGMAEDIRPVG